MSYGGPPIRAVTDDFVESFRDLTDEEMRGGFFRIALMVGLPAGVDPQDERVVQIMERARHANGLTTAMK
jgi:hypothetical protein